MGLSDKALDYLEEHIPELAEVAFKQAYWAALASGSSVLMSENAILLRYSLMEREKSLSAFLHRRL